MDPNLYIVFVLATTVLILMPGPSITLTVAHSLAFGFRRALMTVAGTCAAIVIQLAVTAVGMTSLMLVLADGFQWLRWAGVAYLAYLGIQQWRAEVPAADDDGAQRTSSKALFWQGFVVSATNPKSLFFYAAFFPQFIDPGRPPGLQLLVLSLTFFAIAAVLTGAYAALGGHARDWFRGRRRGQMRNRITGGLLIAAGVGLALARRG